MRVLKKLFQHKFTFILLFYSLISTIALIYTLNIWKLFSLSNLVLDNKLLRRPRILCLVTTYEKNHKQKVRAIKSTWGSRCDILYFASSVTDPSLPSFTVKCSRDDHKHLWCKTQKGIIYGVDTYKDGWDWLLKTDDDTYMIMDNLKYFLSQHNQNEPIWFGFPFPLSGYRKFRNEPAKKYMSGGLDYLFD